MQLISSSVVANALKYRIIINTFTRWLWSFGVRWYTFIVKLGKSCSFVWTGSLEVRAVHFHSFQTIKNFKQTSSKRAFFHSAKMFFFSPETKTHKQNKAKQAIKFLMWFILRKCEAKTVKPFTRCDDELLTHWQDVWRQNKNKEKFLTSMFNWNWKHTLLSISPRCSKHFNFKFYKMNDIRDYSIVEGQKWIKNHTKFDMQSVTKWKQTKQRQNKEHVVNKTQQKTKKKKLLTINEWFKNKSSTHLNDFQSLQIILFILNWGT